LRAPKHIFYKNTSQITLTLQSTNTVLQAGKSLVRFPMLSLEFFIYKILPAALWPWGRLRL